MVMNSVNHDVSGTADLPQFLAEAEAVVLDLVRRLGKPANAAHIGQHLLNAGLNYKKYHFQSLSSLLMRLAESGRISAQYDGTSLYAALPPVPVAARVTAPECGTAAASPPSPVAAAQGKPISAPRTLFPRDLWEATIHPLGASERRFYHVPSASVIRTTVQSPLEPAHENIPLEPLSQDHMMQSVRDFLGTNGVDISAFEDTLSGDRWFAKFSIKLGALYPSLRVPWARRRWELVNAHLTAWAETNKLDPLLVLREQGRNPSPPPEMPGTNIPSGTLPAVLRRYMARALAEDVLSIREKFELVTAAARLLA